MVNKGVPGCQSNYKKRMLTITMYQYLVFQIMKISEMNHEWKRKLPQGNLVVTQNSKVCMKHFEERDLWKHDVFPCSNGDPDIIVSEQYVLMNYNY